MKSSISQVRLFIHVCIYLFIYLFMCEFIYLIYLFVCLFSYLVIQLFSYLPGIYLCICLFVCLQRITRPGLNSPTRTCSSSTIDRAPSRTTVLSEGSASSSSAAISRFLPSGRRHEGHARKPSELDANSIMQTKRIPPDAYVRGLIWQARTQAYRAGMTSCAHNDNLQRPNTNMHIYKEWWPYDSRNRGIPAAL